MRQRTEPSGRRPDPPHSSQAEQAVLGGLTLNGDAWPDVSRRIGAADFYRSDHRQIFIALSELLAAGKACDFLVLTEYLRDRHLLQTVGGPSYIGLLASDYAAAENILAYADVIRDRSLLRHLIAYGQSIVSAAHSSRGRTAEVIIQEATRDLSAIDLRASAQDDRGAWQHQLVVDRWGHVKAQLSNLVTILTLHPAWKGVLGFNEFANRIEKLSDMPGFPGRGEVLEADAMHVARWFGRPETYSLTVRSNLAFEAMLLAAKASTFNPLRDYLEAIKWDGVQRIRSFFSDYCGAPDNEYSQGCAQIFFLSAVARALEPGCKADDMLVLEGRQGIGKTRLVRAICGPKWYAEAQESPIQKDFYQALSGRWIVEIGEMQSFSKAEEGKVKQALSAQSDFYRPSYGRIAQEFPRRCVFVGTTNESVYLKDPTGGRRFLPIRCRGEIDIEAVLKLRDQLWAEAVARLKRGEKWHVPPAGASSEQEERYDLDGWADPIEDYLEGKFPDGRYPSGIAARVDEIRMGDLMTHALGIPAGKQAKADQQRVGRILTYLGWTRYQPSKPNNRGRAWKRPTLGAWPATLPSSNPNSDSTPS